MTQIDELRKELRKHADPEKAKFFPRFFKAGKGEYAEGDQFIGMTVPVMRKIARQFKVLPLVDIKALLYSPFHEERQTALFILVSQFEKGDTQTQQKIYNLYVTHAHQVNNWDLVDSSAGYIVGGYLSDKKDRTILDQFAQSDNLWKRRIAMIATFYFIRMQNDHRDTFRIAKTLLYDKHDLIHKAVGWMLREVGKNISRERLEEFLKKHYKTMPRTMLRYAIEHFEEKDRKAYLQGTK